MSRFRIPNTEGLIDRQLPVDVLRSTAICRENGREHGLRFPADPGNSFEPFLGKKIEWDSNGEFIPGTGPYHALKQLFLVLAGRFELSGPIFALQAEALSSNGCVDPKYFSDSTRHLGLDQRLTRSAPLIMADDGVVVSRGSYLSIPGSEGVGEGRELIDAMAFSRLIATLPKGIEWHDLTGVQSQGFQEQNLELILHLLKNYEPDQRVFLDGPLKPHGSTMKSFRNSIRRLEALGLVEYHQYHGGYIFKDQVWDEITILRDNWADLHNGETVLIGNRPQRFNGEDEAQYVARRNRIDGINRAYNDFVESLGFEANVPVEFTSTDFFTFIKGHRAYSRLGIQSKDIQAFLGRLSDPKRGAEFVDIESTKTGEEYIYTKKEYITFCRKVIGVGEDQPLLFKRIDYSALPATWQGLLESLVDDQAYDPAQRLVIYLAESAGRMVSREDLDQAMTELGVDMHRKSFHTRYMEALDPHLNLVGYLRIPDIEAKETLSRIKLAIDAARRYSEMLSQDQKLMNSMFERNLLPLGHEVRGDSFGYHVLREKAARILVDYLVRYRETI